MEFLKKNFDQLLLSATVGIAGLTTSYVSKMSENVQAMTVSVDILTTKLGSTDSAVKDHEIRIRDLEKKRR